MRIIIDARELRTSTGRYIERLLHYLQQIDNDNDYIVLLYPKDIEGWQPTNPRFLKVACPHKEFTFSEQVGMLRQLKQLNADLVHFGMIQQPVLYHGKTVTTMMDLTTARFRNPSKNAVGFWLKQQLYKWGIRWVAHKSQHIITISNYVKADLAQFAHVNPDKITTTHLAADPIIIEPEVVSGLEDSSFVLYVGRPQPHKNLERLVQAFVISQARHPDLRLVLVGKTDDNYRRLQAWSESRGIKNIAFTGFVSEGQLRWLYEHARVYVFPSLSEGFGLPGLEAMQYGLPVASSNATCLPEVYKNAALYFDPLDINDMAEKIQIILDDPKVAEELAAEALKLVKTYSWHRTAEQTLKIYKDILSK